MNWERMIEEDRIRQVEDDFCIRVLKKKEGRKEALEVIFRKRHFWMSIAAGIMMGLLFSGIYRHQVRHDRHHILKEWMTDCYMDEMELENIEQRIFG